MGPMFETKKTLIVVYKDELLMNQLKKMVETHNADEKGVVGVRDDSINIVSWTEKVWMGNKKDGNIQGKILFLGNIKGTDKLIPVIDVKFDDCGVKFGWAGNQAVLFADPRVLTERKDYDAFLKKFLQLPVKIPDSLKVKKMDVSVDSFDQESGNLDVDGTKQVMFEPSEGAPEEKTEKTKIHNFAHTVRNAVSSAAGVAEKVGNQIASNSEKIFRDRSLMKAQMLFYGVVKLYVNCLTKFMDL